MTRITRTRALCCLCLFLEMSCASAQRPAPSKEVTMIDPREALREGRLKEAEGGFEV